jgi:hypothetical protein
MIYTISEIPKRFSTLLRKALSEGQAQFKTKDGQVFMIAPVRPVRKSPFDVRSLNLPVTKADILESIRESRASGDRFI